MTKIEWTDRVWNFLAGCSPVSEGCRNCYAAKEAVRLQGNPNVKIATKYAGTAEMRGAGDKRRAVFTGRVNVAEEALTKPLGVRKRQRWFVNSMSDLFHHNVPFDVVDRAFAVMALSPQHTFQILTKRPERMLNYLAGSAYRPGAIQDAVRRDFDRFDFGTANPMPWPLPNVWLGTSVENQTAADERVPNLLRCPAAVRFLSCEPLLGPVDLAVPLDRMEFSHDDGAASWYRSLLHWVIVGGESGHGARPMHPEWARSLRDQCQAAGVAFFFKQWGEWAPCAPADWHGMGPKGNPRQAVLSLAGERAGGFLGSVAADEAHAAGWRPVTRIGKHAAGRLLDGVEHNEFPAAVEVAPC